MILIHVANGRDRGEESSTRRNVVIFTDSLRRKI